MSSKKRKKETMSQTAKKWFSMPKKGFYGQPVLHWDCRGFLEIENCKKVLVYTEDEVQLDMGQQIACIRGDELSFSELAGKNLFLKGQVFEIQLKANEQKRRN